MSDAPFLHQPRQLAASGSARRQRPLRRVVTQLLLGNAALAIMPIVSGCDGWGPLASVQAQTPAPPSPLMQASYACTADVRSRAVACSALEPAGGASHELHPSQPSRTILGSEQIRVSSANTQYDSTTAIFSSDLTLKNLLSAAIGTPDGVTPVGVKVFFSTPVHVTSCVHPGDTATVGMHNADGIGNFTAPNQVYYDYPGILAPQETATPKHWEFYIPKTVNSFAFGLKIFTATPLYAWVPLVPPDSVPRALFSSLGTVGEIGDRSGTFVKDIIVLDFNPGTDAASRQSAVDAVQGAVIGGERYVEAPDDGTYYLRVPGGTASSLLHAVMVLQSLPQVAYAARWSLTVPDLELYRRPVDAPGSWRDWHIDPASPEPARPNWALEYIRARLRP